MEAAYANFNRYESGSINVERVLDELAVKSIYYSTKTEALDKLKGVQIIFDDSVAARQDYYIAGNINRWRRYWYWSAPSISKKAERLESTESKWTDDKGKEHTKTTSKYEEKVTENYGGWGVGHSVSASFALVDAKTNKTVVYFSDSDLDNTIIDAYRHCLEKFYKAVNNYFKEHGIK